MRAPSPAEARGLYESTPGADRFGAAEFEAGLAVETEHAGTWEEIEPGTEMGRGDQLRAAAATVMDHLREMPDYYSRLREMESGGGLFE